MTSKEILQAQHQDSGNETPMSLSLRQDKWLGEIAFQLAQIAESLGVKNALDSGGGYPERMSALNVFDFIDSIDFELRDIFMRAVHLRAIYSNVPVSSEQNFTPKGVEFEIATEICRVFERAAESKAAKK